MKSLKLLLLAGVLSLGFNAVSAQTKIAHINTEALVAAMPETKQMQEELKKIAQTYDTEYKAQGNALQAKLQKYDAEAASQTDTENQKRAQEVQDLQKKIQVYAQTAQQELQKKNLIYTSLSLRKLRKRFKKLPLQKASYTCSTLLQEKDLL